MINSEFELENFLFHEMKTQGTLYQNTGFGAQPYQRVFRQVNLGPYGIADLVSFNYEVLCGTIKNSPRQAVSVEIIELKFCSIDIATYIQGIRYASGIKHFFDRVLGASGIEVHISLHLVGKDINIRKKDFIPVYGLIDYVCASTYYTSRDTVRFKSHPGFAEMKNIFSWNEQSGSTQLLNLFIDNIDKMMQEYHKSTVNWYTKQ